MNAEQILDVIASLAQSQGFYGRLLRDIHDDPDILDELVEQNFSDEIAMIQYIEGI